MTDLVAGIDPGKSGAIVVLHRGAIVKWGLLSAIVPKLFLQDLRVREIWIEKAQVMGKESARAMFTYGREYGYMIGTLTGCGFDINYVPPSVWTGVLHKKSPTTFDNPKATSLFVARTIWPTMDWRATEKSRTPHDGIVDAALIAWYGWRYGGNTANPKNGVAESGNQKPDN